MNKTVLLDSRAGKELHKFPKEVQLKFQAMFEILERDGKLEEPFGKKLSGGIKGLFEIRVKYEGQWRSIYAYLKDNKIIILSAFNKKTQKTPYQEIEKAQKRLRKYK